MSRFAPVGPFLAFVASLVVSACATDPARLPLIEPGSASGQRHAIHVVTSRTPATLEEDRFGPGRAETLSFALAEVWVPHDRLPGRIEHPGRRPDPHHEFALADWEDLPTAADFTRSLDARLEAIAFPEREVFLFVHGFNTPFSDGLYLNAQILNDFGVLNAAVHYSWPSAGQIPAYLYDRDSALFARDGLVETLTLLSRS
jgi:esterase/lipase superfamily enzyme